MSVQGIGGNYQSNARIVPGPSKNVAGVSEMSQADLERLVKKAEENGGVVGRANVQEQEKQAPYSFLAVDDGMQKYIEHNGVVFLCDDQKQAITLGDMSNSDNVLTIPLEKGGCLKVNRDNLDDLAKAIDMFSPADVGRIMRAIASDTKVQQMKQEIEEEKNSVVNIG